MNKLEDLHTLVRLLNEFKFPVSPILEYAIREKEQELCADNPSAVKEWNIDITSEDISDESGSSSSLKEEFANYLLKTKSEGSARHYLYFIDKSMRAHIHRIIDSNADSIYACKTLAEGRSFALKLKADSSFMEENARRHNSLTAALSNYLKFLESKEL